MMHSWIEDVEKDNVGRPNSGVPPYRLGVPAPRPGLAALASVRSAVSGVDSGTFGTRCRGGTARLDLFVLSFDE
jgi:hypothetical protein